MKHLVKCAVGAVVLLIVAVVGGFFFLDSLAKTAIERGATWALGVPTTLGSADVGVFSGDFRMKDLHVANPQGFAAAQFLHLGEGYVAVSLPSLRRDTVELPSLTLTNVQMSLEKKGNKSNYGEIADNLKRFESGTDKQAPKSEEGKAYVIKEIVIRDVNVEVDMLPVGGALSKMHVPIKEIRLTDVGSKKSVKMGELTDVIIKAILAAVVAKATDLPGELTKDLGGSLQGLTSLNDLGINSKVDLGKVSEVGKAADDVKKNVEGAAKGVEDISKGLGGLIKKKP